MRTVFIHKVIKINLYQVGIDERAQVSASPTCTRVNILHMLHVREEQQILQTLEDRRHTHTLSPSLTHPHPAVRARQQPCLLRLRAYCARKALILCPRHLLSVRPDMRARFSPPAALLSLSSIALSSAAPAPCIFKQSRLYYKARSPHPSPHI